jgi:5-deoxy-glucuronate isomerase
MAYPKPLRMPPDFSEAEYSRVTPERAAWKYLNFAARKLMNGQTWSSKSWDNEMVVVLLGGEAMFSSDKRGWEKIGRRPDVFSGMPYAVYIPRQTDFEFKALSDELDIGYGWTKTDEDHPMQLVTPEQVDLEVRGGDNMTRQINSIVPPTFDSHKLIVFEAYTPSGNWSSFPPHHHDHRQVDMDENLVETALEEVYFYKIDRPEGFAYQRVYTGDGRIDELMLVRDSDLVLVPEGNHPVVSAPGCNTYYLNFLAGPDKVLVAFYDPDYAWMKDATTSKDPRVPLVSMEMEKE